uniref:Uncharacterized protein n=1 Tax=Rhizophora mucronata TaxID=61149 RepID=A0A2P2PU67_RHIMU
MEFTRPSNLPSWVTNPCEVPKGLIVNSFLLKSRIPRLSIAKSFLWLLGKTAYKQDTMSDY